MKTYHLGFTPNHDGSPQWHKPFSGLGRFAGYGILTFILACFPVHGDAFGQLAGNGTPQAGRSDGDPLTAVAIAGNSLVIGNIQTMVQADNETSLRRRILVTDIDSGATEIIPLPDDIPAGTIRSSFIVSRKHKVYIGEDNLFLEYDPGTREWAHPQDLKTLIMQIKEGPDGTIWIRGGGDRPALLSYNPDTRATIAHEPMKPPARPLQDLDFDDHGWLYGIIDHGQAGLLAYRPATGERRWLATETSPADECGVFSKRMDGLLYARRNGRDHGATPPQNTVPRDAVYYRLTDGTANKVGDYLLPPPMPVKAAGRPVWPDGRILAAHDFDAGAMDIYDPKAMHVKRIEIDFGGTDAHPRPSSPPAGRPTKMRPAGGLDGAELVARATTSRGELGYLDGRNALLFRGPGGAGRATAKTWEPTSRGGVLGRILDDDPASWAGVASGQFHANDLPKDIGVAWHAPVTFEQVTVVYASQRYQPTQRGHELQIWRDGGWQGVDVEVDIRDNGRWDYRVKTPVTASRVRVLVTEFQQHRTATRLFRVYQQYREDRDLLEDCEQELTRRDIEMEIRIEAPEKGKYHVLLDMETVAGRLGLELAINGKRIPMVHGDSVLQHSGHYFAPVPIVIAGPVELDRGEHSLTIRFGESEAPELALIIHRLLLTQTDPAEATFAK